jgi:hypothetical protein
MTRFVELKNVWLLIGFLSLSGLLSAQKSTPAVLTTQGTKIISAEGNPINLCGWRIDFNSWSLLDEVKQADFEHWDSQGLLGNAQAVEIWYSRLNVIGSKHSPSEYMPHLPGVYHEAGIANLLAVMRNIARSGSYIIPSIRVSYDQVYSLDYTKKGTNYWHGWANHRKVIYNSPVVVEEGPNAGTYGNHRDRFFAWLDWILPQILADEEIASKIAYWEMWHYYGHRHNSSAADKDHYLDDFIPKLMAKYRQHDPHRLLGVGITLDGTVAHLISRYEAGNYTPYDDPNWMYVCGGYGRLAVIMRPDNYNPSLTTWPIHSNNPTWLTASSEFNIEKLLRLTGKTMHSQEGPGLRECWRETPIPQTQRTWLSGLYNLYNLRTNGYGFHAWPPSWANQSNSEPLFDPTPEFDETDFFNLTRDALKGIQVNPIYTSTINIKSADPYKVYLVNDKLRVEGLRSGESLEVYTMTGSLYERIVSSSDQVELSLQKGFYLVKTNEFTKKVVMY